MAISFDTIPGNLRRPGVYAEISGELATRGLRLKPYKALVIGQRRSTGSVAELTPTRVTTPGQAAEYFGEGSMLHGMAEAFFANNRFTETWFVAIDDAGGAAAATRTLTFTGPASANGTVALMVAGRRVSVGVLSSDSATTVAAATAAAVNARTDLPVTAAAVDEVATLTAKNAGAIGAEIPVLVNYFEGDALPTDVGLTIGAWSGGSGVVDLDELWPVLGDEHYDVIASPYIDAANLSSLEEELESRWDGTRMIEGVAMLATNAAFAAAATLGESRNSLHTSIQGAQESPSPIWEWAAATAGLVAFYGNQDPARPFNTLAVEWVRPPLLADRWTNEEKNLALYSGISTSGVDAGGQVRVERLITTYRENAFGAPDEAYLDLNTPLTLGLVRWSTRVRLMLRYPRHKLGNDSDRYGAGQAIATPSTIRAELIAHAAELHELGLLEDLEQFERDLIVERNPTDRTRVDIQMSPNVVNQLHVIAIKISFLL